MRFEYALNDRCCFHDGVYLDKVLGRWFGGVLVMVW